MINTKLVEGAFGLSMPEETARTVDTLLKHLPTELRTLKRKTTVTTDIDLVPGEKADVSLVSTDAVDREGEVVLQMGIDLATYRSNPVVMWCHKFDMPPVGRAKWIKPVEGGLLAKTQFPSRPDDYQGNWFPDEVFSLVQQGIIKGRSIGFIALEVRPPTQQEKAIEKWSKAEVVIPRSLLLEYSVCALPVNQEALTVAVSKGLDLALLNKLGIKAPKRKRKQDPNVQLLGLLELIKFNPEAIAQQALEAMRGKV